MPLRNLLYSLRLYLVKKPIFIDVFITTIGFILEGEKDMFYAIDVGLTENQDKLKKTKGQAKLQEFEHEFEEESKFHKVKFFK